MLPKGYYPEDVEEDVRVPQAPKQQPGGRPLWWRAMPIIVVVVALAAFTGLLLITYFSGGRSGDGPTPLIHADANPVKVRPENPGGMEVPFQDIDLLNGQRPNVPQTGRTGDATAPRVVERLLPPPESPLPRPTAAPPILQPEIPVAPIVAPPPDAVDVMRLQQQPPQQQSAQQQRDPRQQRQLQLQPAQQQEAQAPRRLTLPPALLQGQPESTPSSATSGRIVLRPPGSAQQQAVAPTHAQEQGTVPVDLPGFRVQLGSMRSADVAEREWQRLRDNHGDLLGRLSATVVPSGRGAAASYKIQAGPLLTESGAAGLCRRLASRGIGCFVVKR